MSEQMQSSGGMVTMDIATWQNGQKALVAMRSPASPI